MTREQGCTGSYRSNRQSLSVFHSCPCGLLPVSSRSPLTGDDEGTGEGTMSREGQGPFQPSFPRIVSSHASLSSHPEGSPHDRTERTKRESNGVRRGPRDSILFTLNLFIPHAFVIFILFVFHLLRLVQGKLYRYSPRLIENLPKAGINLGFSFFICRTFIIGGFY